MRVCAVTFVVVVGLLVTACSSSPVLKVDNELVEKLPEAQQQRISRLGLGREDAKEQKEKALRMESQANDAFDKAKQDRKNAELALERAKAAVDAAETRQELEEANVQLARAMTSAAEQNLSLSLLNFELEKAKAVQASGLQSPAEIGLVQFEKESYESQKKLTETNLRTVEYQNKIAKLTEELREKQERVRDLQD